MCSISTDLSKLCFNLDMKLRLVSFVVSPSVDLLDFISSSESTSQSVESLSTHDEASLIRTSGQCHAVYAKSITNRPPQHNRKSQIRHETSVPRILSLFCT